MKERLKGRLRELTALVGVSGAEQDVVTYIRDAFKPIADNVEVDNWGNVIAIKKGSKPGPNLMLSAHSDEIGMVVKSIHNNGFITFGRVGGVNDILLPGRKVLINGRIPGVIGVKAGHLQTPEEQKTVKPIGKCYIDVGAFSREEVESMGIEIGDRIVFQSDFMELMNKDLISTKAVDNRISCAILIELLEQIKDMNFAGTIYAAVCVQEEIGLRGAFMTANRIKPDYAIVMDTIPCGDTPDIDTEKQLPIRLGKGPACPVIDGIDSAFSYNVVHPKVRKIIAGEAAKAGVNIQYVTLSGEWYTTDATHISMAAEGIPVGLLTTPRRYSHSPVELVDINDPVGIVKILKGIVSSNGTYDISFI
jgi:putative aminopeptidase FrvX